MSAEWDCEYCGVSNLGSVCPCGRPDELDRIKEIINGASQHPETGVSVVDDVRDLVKEVAGYKAQVAGQAKYIECLLAEIADYKERIAEFVKGA